jgi:hypothetical protein
MHLEPKAGVCIFRLIGNQLKIFRHIKPPLTRGTTFKPHGCFDQYEIILFMKLEPRMISYSEKIVL